ncbi:MAG: hypothetical protein HOH13_03825 [Crocinitomicaceae bacterium]|jgi:DNA repair ATPase RecN|nr:hypothetical protein [Crocinitomicaceae bacterium]MBT6029408.1 hypothetical protein [Crocinitomicaceae bacterium]
MKKLNLFMILTMLAIGLGSCGGAEEKPSWEDAMDEAMSDYEDAMDEFADELDDATEEIEEAVEDEEVVEAEETEGGDSGEWDSLLDDYESFADDYIAALKKQKADPTDMSVMTDMAALAPKAAEWSTKMSEAAATLSAEQAGRMTKIGNKIAAAVMP